MKVKKFTAFFSILFICLGCIIIYNVYANNSATNGSPHSELSYSSLEKPTYTYGIKPTKAPKEIKDEAEAESLFTQA